MIQFLMRDSINDEIRLDKVVANSALVKLDIAFCQVQVVKSRLRLAGIIQGPMLRQHDG